MIRLHVALALFLVPALVYANPHQMGEHEEPAPADTSAADTTAAEDSGWDVNTSDMGPQTSLTPTVSEGTWMSLDVSPDGKTIAFDLLGDIYTLPITGGSATLLRGGRAYEIQPRFSPDGGWISFTSDAGGGDNIWVMRADGTDSRQITKEDFRLLNNAVWTPDGRYLVAKKHFSSRRSLGAGEMWMYDVAHGGAGVQLTKRPNDQKDVGEPEISPDGRYLFYSIDSTPGSSFSYNKDPNTTIYTLRRVDLVEGGTETLVSRPGGSVRPEISPDGRTLAYVGRARLNTVLMLRDLETGIDRPLFAGLSKDSQETWAVHGVYPGFAWTPDGASIVIWAQGKIHRVSVSTGEASVIPFTADMEIPVVEALRFRQEIGGDTFPVRVVRTPRVSPDGTRVVFQALGRLWTRDLAGGAPRRLTHGSDTEAHPVWTPDGRRIVYVSWNDTESGRVRVVGSSGGSPRNVVTRPGHYSHPQVSPDGKEVVYRRGGGDGYRGNHHVNETGIYIVPLAGGEPRLVTEDGLSPGFDTDGERILLYQWGDDTKTLYSVDRLGGTGGTW